MAKSRGSILEAPKRLDSFLTNQSPIHVLVVEDEFFSRLHAVDLVDRAGYKAVQAANADEAIAILEARKGIRIVLKDIDMPGSMDGIALVNLISKRWPPCRLILVSGMRAPRDKDLPERTYFIPKPVSAAVLDRTLIALDLAA